MDVARDHSIPKIQRKMSSNKGQKDGGIFKKIINTFPEIYNPTKVLISFEVLKPVEAFGDVEKLPFVSCVPAHVLLHSH